MHQRSTQFVFFQIYSFSRKLNVFKFMSISETKLQEIAKLASLNINTEISQQLIKEIDSIMVLVDKLKTINTSGITPLCHPIEFDSPLREDVVKENNNIDELAKNAPLFEDGLYIVPKVIDAGK